MTPDVASRSLGAPDATDAATAWPLAGVRVLDLTDALGAYASRLLALLGADVLRVDLAGAPSTDLAPRHPSRPDLSLFDLYVNENKARATLDPACVPDVEALTRLAAGSDVVLWSSLDGPRGELWERVAALRPAQELVLTLITPYGLDGPYAEHPASDATIMALGGLLSIAGYPDQPVLPFGEQALFAASLHATLGTLVALRHLERTGVGQEVDVAAQDAVAHALENAVQYVDLEGKVRQRLGNAEPEAGTGVFACADGYVFVMSSLQGSLLGWDAVVKWIATVEPAIAEELSDPTWKSAAYRATVEAKARFREIFERFSAPRPKRWLYEEGQGFGVSIAPLTTPSDICADPHLEARGFFGSAASDGAGTTVGHPAAPFRLPDLPGHWRDWRAPEPLRSVDRPEWTPRRRRRPGTPARRPLEGIRVIDFTWVGVGPFATKFLADNGADVIKVESATRLDPIRMMHPAAEGKPGVNRSGYFANRNSSKRAITLNLKSEPGIDIAHRLIAGADIVINNFRPGVMQSNRLGPDDLRSIREDLIYVDMPMMGSGGPYSKFGGYGLVMTAVGGLFGLTGLPGRQPVGTGTNYPDHVPNPLHAAMAILAALRRRDRTGEGAYVEISQVESTLALLGPHLMRALAGGEDPVVPGNRHGDHAPQGVFPCVEDGWCALTVRGDEDWAALCRLLDRADLAGRFARAEDRRAAAAQPEIEAALAAWTATRTSAQAMEQLLAAGVPAGAVQDAREVLFDPQLAHRRHWVRLEHPEMGVAVYDGPVAQLSQTPAVLSRPAPLLGQHTREVCAELLGIAGDDFEALRACGTFD